jgi:hypothetical protein
MAWAHVCEQQRVDAVDQAIHVLLMRFRQRVSWLSRKISNVSEAQS